MSFHKFEGLANTGTPLSSMSHCLDVMCVLQWRRKVQVFAAKETSRTRILRPASDGLFTTDKCQNIVTHTAQRLSVDINSQAIVSTLWHLCLLSSQEWNSSKTLPNPYYGSDFTHHSDSITHTMQPVFRLRPTSCLVRQDTAQLTKV